MDNITGTAGNDTFNVTLVNSEAAAAATGTTYQVSDLIDGGAGTSDTLAILVAGSNSAAGPVPLAQTLGAISNVEILSIKNLSTGTQNGVTIAAGSAAGLTTVANNGSTAAVAVTGVASNAAVSVTSSKTATSVAYADGKVTGGVTLNVSAAGTSTTNETITLSTASAAGTATAVTINATGANYLALAAGGTDATSVGATNGIKTVTVTGSGSVALTSGSTLTNTGSLAGDVTKWDASANTGGLTATVSNTTSSGVTVIGGSGNDSITVGGALAAGASVSLGAGNDKLLNSSGSIAASTASKTTLIDGGDGTDTLAASLITAGNGAVFKNFEILSLGGASVDASLLTNSTLTGLSVDALLGGSYTYTNITPAMSLNDAFAGDNSARTTTLTFTSASVSGTSDTYAISFAAPDASAAQTSADTKLGTVAAAGIENFTIASGGTNHWNSLTLGADSSANTVVITGSTNLDLAFASGFGNTTAPKTGVSLIDGSAATGKLAITLTNVVNATAGIAVKGGSADDTITTTVSQAATLTGGAGKDNFVVGATVYGASSYVTTITDPAAGDKITLLDQGTETFATAKKDVSAATNLASAIGIAAGAVNGSANGAITWFQYAGNTYLVELNTDKSGGAGTDASTGDVIVKLTGLYDLSTATGAGTNVLTLA